MSTDNLRQRGKALEDMFFAHQDEILLQKLREQSERQEQKKLLTQITGIEQDEALDHILDLGMDAEHILALTLIPLLEVAWADGTVQERERDAILEAASESGVEADSPSHELLQTWLKHPPQPAMLEAWHYYVVGLCASLDPAAAHDLRDRIMARARRVAEAAGGILGLGNKVSPSEQETLDRLAAAFSS